MVFFSSMKSECFETWWIPLTRPNTQRWSPCDICGFKESIEKVHHHKSAEHGKQNESWDIGLKVAVAEGSGNKNLTFVGLDEYFLVQDTNRMKCQNCFMIFQIKDNPAHILHCNRNKFFCALCCTSCLSQEALDLHWKETHFQLQHLREGFFRCGCFGQASGLIQKNERIVE